MSNRRLAHTYTLHAEFDGEGVLAADLYPLYPRAFLWAHLDDGIMESVTTNWGNEGIFMEGVGPSLVGRFVDGLGPLQRIPLGGALYFDTDGNLAYDPSALVAQIEALGSQQVSDEAVIAALQAQLAADETLISTNATAIATLQTALTTTNAQIAAANSQIVTLQQQVAFLLATAQLKPSFGIALAGAGGLTVALQMQALLGAQLSGSGILAGTPILPTGISYSAFGTGGLTADLQLNAIVQWSGTARLSGSGGLTAGLGIQSLLAAMQLSGLGSLTGDLISPTGITYSAKGAGGLTAMVGMQGLLGAQLSGSGSLAALLGRFYFVNPAGFAGVGSVSVDLQRLGILWDGTASLSGSGGLVVPAAQQLATGAQPSGIGSLTGTASLQSRISAAFAAAGSISTDLTRIAAIGSTQWNGAANLSGSGSITVLPLTQRLSVNAVLAAAGSISVDLQQVMRGVAQWPGTANLSGSGGLVVPATQWLTFRSNLAGVGGLTGAITLVPGVTYSAWDPANSNAANITFSNSNRTVRNSTQSGIFPARGTLSNNSGKLYFEITLNAIDSFYPGQTVGVCNASFPSTTVNNSPGGDSNSVGLRPINSTTYQLWANNTAGTSFTFTVAAGDVIGVAVDWVSNPFYVTISFRVNGIWLNSSGVGSPSFTLTNSDGSLTAPVALYPATAVAGSNFGGGSQHTLNVGNAAFAYSLPPGYTAWT